MCAKSVEFWAAFFRYFLFGVSTFFNFFNPHVTFIFLSLSLSLASKMNEEREKERENRLSLYRAKPKARFVLCFFIIGMVPKRFEPFFF